MSWRKNAFSYVCWFLYAVLTGTATLCLAGYVAETMRLGLYWAMIFGVLYALGVAVLVVLLHRISIEASAYFATRRWLEGLSKAILLAILATIGLYLRLRMIDGVEMLNELLALNILAELILQMVVAFLLFFLLNKLSGYFCGLTVFGFMMCSSQFVQGLQDKPTEMLSLLVLLLVFGVMIIGYQKSLYPFLYFFYGALAAFVSCLDIMGILLLAILLAMVFVQRKYGAGVWKKLLACVCGVLGFATGLCGCLLVESLLDRQDFKDLFVTRINKYSPEAFRIPLVGECEALTVEVCVLVGLMIFGIFSFWYDRNREGLSLGTVLWCGLIALSCFGMEGSLLSGTFLIYLLMVVLAGVGVQQCICGICVPRELVLPEEPEIADGMREDDLTDAVAGMALDEAAPEYEQDDLADAVAGMALDEAAPEYEQDNLTEQVYFGEDTVTDDRLAREAEEESAMLKEAVAEIQKQKEEATEELLSPEKPEEIRKTQYIDNPLPLPKKHEKRVLDFDLQVTREASEYDVLVAEDEDFDI